MEDGGFAGTERFAVHRRVGAGGMGVVYEATDRERNLRVALKTIRTSEPGSAARLKREFRALQDVEHPNLVSLGELFEVDGRWFYTMELVPGTDFTRWVRREHGFDEPRLREALVQLASALTALHDVGLVHRDVKPSNVRVTPEGRVVLLDFGLITDASGSSLTADPNIVGTVAYMAPEQAAAQAVEAAADWYAVGVLLYEALTGRLPYAGSGLQVLMDKQQRAPEPPGALAPGVPADLEALCMQLLRFAPRERPNGRAVLRRLGARTRQPVTVSRSSQFSEGSSLFGRAAELAVLEAAYADVSAGQTVCVAVRGASGMGKTALVSYFTSVVHPSDDHHLVLAGRCYERETVPYKALDGVIDALARALQRLPRVTTADIVPPGAALLPRVFPALARVEAIARAPQPPRPLRDPLELRARAFAALRDLLCLLAERRQLTVVIDDLHWADSDSLKLLGELLRPIDGAPMLLLVTTRGELPAALPCEVREVEVSRLDEASCAQLARWLVERLGVDAVPTVDAMVREAHGHPLFIHELARHAALAGDPRPGDVKPPMELDDAIWSRAQQLPPGARAVLELLAVAGVPLRYETVLRASELAPEDYARQLAVLRIGNFARTAGDPLDARLELFHDRVRAAALDRMTDVERVARHARLAIGLELTQSPEPELLATHLLGAGERDRAREVIRRAADAASNALAFDRAARLYRHAIELLDDGDAARFELHRALGDVLANAGRGPEAADAYLAALPGAGDADRMDLQRAAATQLLASGQVDDGLDRIDEYLRAGGLKLAASPRAALLRLLGLRARIRLRGYRFQPRDEREVPASQLVRIDVAQAVGQTVGMVDVLQAACFQARSVLLALRAGEPHRVAVALAGEAVFLSLAGRGVEPRAERLLDAVRDIARRHPSPALRGISVGARGMVAFNMGRVVECHDLCRKAAQIFREECVGYRWELATAEIFEGFALAMMGRLAEAIARIPQLIRSSLDRGDLYAATTLQASVGVYVPLALDDPDEAQRTVEEAVRRWSVRGYHLQHANAANALGMIDLYRGHPRAALDRLDREWPSLARSMLLRTQLMRVLFWRMRGVAALGVAQVEGDQAALRVARRAVRALERERVPYASWLALSMRSGLALAAGDRDEAIDLLARANREADAVGLGLERLAQQFVHGVLLGGAEGGAIHSRATAAMRAQGIAAPHRVARMWLPWAAPLID